MTLVTSLETIGSCEVGVTSSTGVSSSSLSLFSSLRDCNSLNEGTLFSFPPFLPFDKLRKYAYLSIDLSSCGTSSVVVGSSLIGEEGVKVSSSTLLSLFNSLNEGTLLSLPALPLRALRK